MAHLCKASAPRAFCLALSAPSSSPVLFHGTPNSPHRAIEPHQRSRRQMSSASKPRQRSLNIDNINPNVKKAEYAVRGELAVRAEKYRQHLEGSQQTNGTKGHGDHTNGIHVDSVETNGLSDLPFDSVISANIGNPQQLGQKPFTFFRQVSSLVENPDLMENEKVLTDNLGYKPDVIERAKALLRDVGSVGSYSISQGSLLVRKSVAKYIENRDGYPSDPSHIYLTAGASAGVSTLLNLLCSSPKTGVLVPIPQYPLYTATLALLGAQCVPYFLDESEAWGTNISQIHQSLKEARGKGIDVRCIAVINPGNPTGSCLSREEVASILELVAEEKLVLLADEVYQQNIFKGEFYSFKKVLREMQNGRNGAKFENVELASLHSISKGMVGECGQRGGYLELDGFDEEVEAQIYKLFSIALCPPVVGQCLVECMVNPPKEGEPSYPVFHEEKTGISDDLKHRANALYEAFCDMEGVNCQKPQGAMYLFPTITVPQKAVDEAKKEGRTPDEFYVSRLLDSTGICMIPGTGFGQQEGTLHLRTTFLAPGTEWVSRITEFHKEFMDEYR